MAVAALDGHVGRLRRGGHGTDEWSKSRRCHSTHTRQESEDVTRPLDALEEKPAMLPL